MKTNATKTTSAIRTVVIEKFICLLRARALARTRPKDTTYYERLLHFFLPTAYCFR
jgi:hypothetical protein